MTNYHNTLTEIDSINTTHLGEKASSQVNDFVTFVKPLIPDIRKGEAAKAKIAEYYLEHKSQYTDGCIKVLEPLVNQLGVSGGYISQIKKAKEYKDNIHNKNLKQWVEEHPVSVQYYIAKSPHDKVMEKFQTGEHCSKREAQDFTRVKTEPDTTPVAEEVKTEYQLRCEREQALVEDSSYPYLSQQSFASTFMGGTTNSILAACMEKVSRLSTCDDKRQKQLDHLIHLCQEAKKLPSHYSLKYFSESK